MDGNLEGKLGLHTMASGTRQGLLAVREEMDMQCDVTCLIGRRVPQLIELNVGTTYRYVVMRAYVCGVFRCQILREVAELWGTVPQGFVLCPLLLFDLCQ